MRVDCPRLQLCLICTSCHPCLHFPHRLEFPPHTFLAYPAPPLSLPPPVIVAQEALQHWRTKISTNGREWEERNRALRNEKEIMTRHYSGLKVGEEGGRGADGGDESMVLPFSRNGQLRK